MLKLNIIPTYLKKEIKLIDLYKSFKNLFYVLIILTALYCIILLLGNLILKLHFIDTVAETSFITKNTENYYNIIKNINNKVANIDNIQKDYILWSYLIEYLSNNTNDNIEIFSININKSKDIISISGKAKTRDDLLEYKNTFSNSIYFSAIDLPIENLLTKENVSFNITTNIKSYEFNKL